MNEKTHSKPRAKVKLSEFPQGISEFEVCCLTNDAMLKLWVVPTSKKMNSSCSFSLTGMFE